jgi:CheY-like chemotaxis protein
LIAVVDDDEVLDGLRLALEHFGYEVIAGADPDTLLRQAGRLDRLPDLILSDYRLGESVTGAEAISRLRREWGGAIPAIVFTGDSSSAALREVHAAGHPVLHKPVDADQLQELLAKLLAAGRAFASAQMRRVASKPSTSGIPRSISTRSGLRRIVSSMASRPLDACPTT